MFHLLKKLFQKKQPEMPSPHPETCLRPPMIRPPQISDERAYSPAVSAFLNGETNSLTAADIDPENAITYGRYTRACELKKQGDLEGAAILLESFCIPPSIYSGHYRLLFQIWRHFNRIDLKKGHYENVVQRVTKMIRYDEEMCVVLVKYWGEVQNKILPQDHFDGARNLKVSDAKALLNAATALSNTKLAKEAELLVRRF